MKQLTILISTLFFLVIGVSHVWALPACPSSGYFHNCYGTYTKAYGGIYVGEWQNDGRHGQGTFTFTNGDKYVGEWKDGKTNGQGTYTYSDGEKYVGETKDFKKHGQGIYTYASGSKWDGEWENNKLNGYAIRYYADGSINQEGIFKDDKFLYTEKRSKPIITPTTDSELDKYKKFCEEIGFTPKTEGFGNCVLELMKKD